MKIVRFHMLSRLITLLMGALLLNMSFFLTEINVMHVEKKSKARLESLAKLITGFEEENDASGESHSPESFDRDFDLFYTHPTQDDRRLVLLMHLSEIESIIELPAGCLLDPTTPPPRG